MKLLTKQMQNDMARQMCNKARDIDVTMYNALDGTMPNTFVLDCLMMYQTKDGGFAGGLQIDNYNTNTSVYQIYEAYRLLDMAGFDYTCKEELYLNLINKSMNYLYNRNVPIKNKWNANTLTNNSFAHHLMFEFNEENTKMFGYHPTSAILGYTLLFCEDTKCYFKKAYKMAEVMLKEFYQMNMLTKYEFISFNSFYNSIKKRNLFIEEQQKIHDKLVELALNSISVDFNNHKAILPLDCALYLDNKELQEKVDLQLDYIIDSIAPHGLWDYTDDWGTDKYAEQDSAKLKWLGALTVNNYFVLKKYGRIE